MSDPRPRRYPLVLIIPLLCWALGACGPAPSGAEPDPAPEPEARSAEAPAPAQSRGSSRRGGTAQALVDALNDARAEAGLEPFLRDDRLDRVAEERARELADQGTVGDDQTALGRVSNRLTAAGYGAQQWMERAILGTEAPEELLEGWRRGGSGFRDSALGDFDQVGIGIARGTIQGRSGHTVVLLFAVPRLAMLERVTQPLADLEEVQRRVLEAVNRERRRAGQPAVELDPALNRAAQAYARRMLDEGFYSHRGPRGSSPEDRARDAGYPRPGLLAENIAKNVYEPGEVVDRWMASPGHRKNILAPRATEMGIGVAVGVVEGDDGLETIDVLWVQLFGRPL